MTRIHCCNHRLTWRSGFVSAAFFAPHNGLTPISLRRILVSTRPSPECLCRDALSPQRHARRCDGNGRNGSPTGGKNDAQQFACAQWERFNIVPVGASRWGWRLLQLCLADAIGGGTQQGFGSVRGARHFSAHW